MKIAVVIVVTKIVASLTLATSLAVAPPVLALAPDVALILVDVGGPTFEDDVLLDASQVRTLA